MYPKREKTITSQVQKVQRNRKKKESLMPLDRQIYGFELGK
jgi:hypothetical protein